MGAPLHLGPTGLGSATLPSENPTTVSPRQMTRPPRNPARSTKAYGVLSFAGVLRRGVLILCAACVLATTATSLARAGSYHVLACSNMGATNAPIPNNAWTQVRATAPPGLEAFVSCPPQDSATGTTGSLPRTACP